MCHMDTRCSESHVTRNVRHNSGVKTLLWWSIFCHLYIRLSHWTHEQYPGMPLGFVHGVSALTFSKHRPNMRCLLEREDVAFATHSSQHTRRERYIEKVWNPTDLARKLGDAARAGNVDINQLRTLRTRQFLIQTSRGYQFGVSIGKSSCGSLAGAWVRVCSISASTSCRQRQGVSVSKKTL